METQSLCPSCKGDGYVYETPCNSCKGNGVTNKQVSVDVTVPYGVVDGDGIEIVGGGNDIKNGVSGVVVIFIHIDKHKEYTRVGNDLRLKAKLTYSELVLGCEFILKTIEGKKIKVNIPELSKVDDNLRLKGLGMKQYKTEMRGDVILELNIKIPDKITDEEKELIKKLAQIGK
jgi:molecular chaperone DnaJ